MSLQPPSGRARHHPGTGHHAARRIGYAALSAIIPGLGQLALGYRRRGLLMLAVSVLLTALGTAVWRLGPVELLILLTDPTILLWALVLNAAVLAFRVFAVVDAYRLSAPHAGDIRHSLKRFITASVMGVLLAVTAAPHMAAGYYNILFYDLLTDVFQPSAAVITTPTPAPAPTQTPALTQMPVQPAIVVDVTPTPAQPTPTTTSRSVPAQPVPWVLPTQPAAVAEPTATHTPTPAPTETPTPEPTATPDPAIAGRMNVLLLGSDAGPGRSGARTDTIMVASFDPTTGHAALFGIPRNFVGVPLPDTSPDLPYREWPRLINALYGYGAANPHLFPGGEDSGATALKGAIGALLGIHIDYYAMVDMQGFVEVIDALGGVTVDVQSAVVARLSPPGPDDDWQSFNIQPGRQHLSGHEALAYARSRQGTSDYDRMHRQRCVLGAIGREADIPSLLLAFPSISEIIRAHVSTDIPLDMLPDFIRLADSIVPSNVIVVGFTPPGYTAGVTENRYPIPDIPRIQERVQQAMTEDPAQQPAGDRVAESCGWEGD